MFRPRPRRVDQIQLNLTRNGQRSYRQFLRLHSPERLREAAAFSRLIPLFPRLKTIRLVGSPLSRKLQLRFEEYKDELFSFLNDCHKNDSYALSYATGLAGWDESNEPDNLESLYSLLQALSDLTAQLPRPRLPKDLDHLSIRVDRSLSVDKTRLPSNPLLAITRLSVSFPRRTCWSSSTRSTTVLHGLVHLFPALEELRVSWEAVHNACPDELICLPTSLTHLRVLRLDKAQGSADDFVASIERQPKLFRVELFDVDFTPGLTEALVLLSQRITRKLEVWVKIGRKATPVGWFHDNKDYRETVRREHEASCRRFYNCFPSYSDRYTDKERHLADMLHYRDDSRCQVRTLEIWKPRSVACVVCDTAACL